MSKSGKTSFYQKAISRKDTLKKGLGPSFDHFKREMMKTMFAMKLSGKSDDEIFSWLEAKFNEAMKAKENK